MPVNYRSNTLAVTNFGVIRRQHTQFRPQMESLRKFWEIGMLSLYPRVTKDQSKSSYWMQKAAEQEHAKAGTFSNDAVGTLNADFSAHHPQR